MQYDLPLDAENPLVRAHLGLLTAFGRPPACFRLDPISQMVLTLLSARTRSGVAKKVFEHLATDFSSWEELARTPSREIRELINPVTYAERKSVFLSCALQTIMRHRGVLSLDFLDAWPIDAAQSWLEKLPGVGPKTSAAILNFSLLHKPALVVNTAHWRAARRLNLISKKVSLAQAPRVLTMFIPASWTADDIEEHHALMQQLGQTYCTHSDPVCCACPLHFMCACIP